MPCALGVVMLDTAWIDRLGTPVFVLEPDAAGRPVYAAANAAWHARTDYPEGEIAGKTAEQIFGGRFGRVAYQHHVDVLSSGQTGTYDILLPLADKIHTVRTNLKPTLNPDGTVVCIVGSSIDMTSDMDEVIYMAAHDLRSPMRNIASLTDMLLEDALGMDDETSQTMHLIRDISAKAADLISDLLAHAQASSGVQPSETFDVGPMVADILMTLDPGRTHGVVCGAGAVHSDNMAFQIAVRNLMDNAIKHCGRDHVRFGIDVSDAGDDMISVRVTDNGTGFDAPETLFGDTGKMMVNGGFGLHGVRRMVQARGGEIAASNLPGGAGGQVLFTLPGRIATDASV